MAGNMTGSYSKVLSWRPTAWPGVFPRLLSANLHQVTGVDNAGVLLENVLTVQTDALFVFAGLFW